MIVTANWSKSSTRKSRRLHCEQPLPLQAGLSVKFHLASPKIMPNATMQQSMSSSIGMLSHLVHLEGRQTISLCHHWSKLHSNLSPSNPLRNLFHINFFSHHNVFTSKFQRDGFHAQFFPISISPSVFRAIRIPFMITMAYRTPRRLQHKVGAEVLIAEILTRLASTPCQFLL